MTIRRSRILATGTTGSPRSSSPRDALLVAYADPQFAGAVTTFSAGKHALLPDGWDDEISSARCNCR